MKMVTVQVRFEAEKYTALVRYAKKKDISMETELTETIEKLYKKLVPPDVREFIEETEPDTFKDPKPKRRDKTAVESTLACSANMSDGVQV